MNEIIKIDVNENLEQVVSARELHEKLGIEKRFSAWWEQQVSRMELAENKDYCTCGYTNSNNQSFTDYIMPIDTAKHLCMISGGEKARLIREYFILIEKAWNSPDQVMARAIQFSSKKIASLQGEIAELLPKAEAHDLLISASNAQPVGVVAKILGTGRNRLFKLLREKKILMRGNVPYQDYVEAGYFIVKEKPITMGTETVNKPQTYITAKGVDWLCKKMKEAI